MPAQGALARSVSTVASAVGKASGERATAPSVAPRDAGREALGAIAQAASGSGNALPRLRSVTTAVSRVRSSPVTTATQAATQAIVHAGGRAHVADTLAANVSAAGGALAQAHVSTARKAPTQTASAAGAGERLGGAGASRGGAIARSPGHATVVASAVIDAVAATGASELSSLQNGLQPLVVATRPAPAGFGPWSIPAAAVRGRIGAAIASMAQLRATAMRQNGTELLTGGQSAVSSSARGAHPAPPPARPASVPASPGAVPPAAAGSGGGASAALVLAALLMLAAPWALRRVRLASESWRLAPLVLISDRPG